jgi:hypothetical protein
MRKQQKKQGYIISLDGKRTITLEEFDRIADSGSDEIDEFIDLSKGVRGGVRTGAGRKRKESVRLEVRIRPELRDKLRRKARQTGRTQVELVEAALEQL